MNNLVYTEYSVYSILKILWQEYQIYTSVQIGSDTEVASILAEKSVSFTLINENTEWGNKTKLNHEFTTNILFDEETEVFDFIKETQFDFAYIHNIGTFDYLKTCNDLLKLNRAKIILGHHKNYPIMSVPSLGYKSINLPGGYILQYLILEDRYKFLNSRRYQYCVYKQNQTVFL